MAANLLIYLKNIQSSVNELEVSDIVNYFAL